MHRNPNQPSRSCSKQSLITGQYRNTNIDALHLESGIPSYKTHSDHLIATAYEKGMRLPADHPRRKALDKQVTHRHTLRSSLREKGKTLSQGLATANTERRATPILIHKPWTSKNKNWHVTTNEAIKHDIPAIKNAIQDLGSEVVIYTDGSCTGGTSDGGAAAVFFFFFRLGCTRLHKGSPRRAHSTLCLSHQTIGSTCGHRLACQCRCFFVGQSKLPKPAR